MEIQLGYKQILEYIIFAVKNERYQEAVNLAQDCIDSLDSQKEEKEKI